MKISAINFNNFKIQNLKSTKNQTTNSIKKNNNFMPTTAQYLAFCGGYSVNLAQTYNNLEDNQYPQDIKAMVQDTLKNGNPTQKTLCDVHFEKYRNILNCFTLDELKEAYPEFENVKSAFDVVAKEDSFIGEFQNKKSEIFNTDEDLTLQLIKLYWGQGFSLNDISRYIAQNSQNGEEKNIYPAMKKLNIPTMGIRYAKVLKLSNKEYNDNFTLEMSKRLREAKEAKKQFQEGEPVYIPRGPLSESHKQHISEGLKKYYLENPQKIYTQSQRQKAFYEAHPEKKEEFSQVLSYAWNNTKEGASLAKHISKFAKKYNNSRISPDELSGKKEMDSRANSALGEFWKINKWASKQFSIAMTKGWESVKVQKRSLEDIYNYKTIPNEQLALSLIPMQLRKGMEDWFVAQGYDLKDFVFCKALIFKEDNADFQKLQNLANKKSQKIVAKYINTHPQITDILANSMQFAIIDVMKDLESINLKLPKSLRKDYSKVMALHLIFEQHLQECPIYKTMGGQYIPIDGVEMGYLNDIYANFVNYAYTMGCEDFAPYIENKLNEQFAHFYKKNPFKLN